MKWIIISSNIFVSCYIEVTNKSIKWNLDIVSNIDLGVGESGGIVVLKAYLGNSIYYEFKGVILILKNGMFTYLFY